MTFDDAVRLLPNGLHDAELLSIAVDYRVPEAIIEVNVDVSRPDDEVDSYRCARLRFLELQFLTIEPPDPKYDSRGVSTIDAGSGHAPTSGTVLPALGEGTSLCWLFVSGWNAFIHIAARDIELVLE
jgi:hypothetical protein